MKHPISNSQPPKSRDPTLALNPNRGKFSSINSRAVVAIISLFFLPLLSLRAATNADVDEIPPLRPPREEIAPTFWEQHGVLVLILGALGLFIIIAAVRFLTRPKPTVMLSPEEEARRALEPLREQPETGVVLSKVSLTLRHYLSRAFKLPPGEMTTTDCCRALESNPQVEPDFVSIVAEFLRACDYRKFAPGASSSQAAGSRPSASLSPSEGERAGVRGLSVTRALEIIELAEARLAYLRQAAAEAEKTRNAGSRAPQPHTTG